MVRVKEKALRKLSEVIFTAVGASDEEAQIVTDVLVDTSRHGVDSHGVRAIPGYITRIKEGKLVPRTPISILRDVKTTAMWDAGSGFGFVAGYKAMENAVEKAKKFKMGSVGLKGTGHIGALYWYSYQAVKKKMIGITLCRGGGHSAVPYGGVEGRLGINPLSIAIPTGPKYQPIILDMATTGVAMGHLRVMAVRGEKAPEGWLLKADSTWSTDPLAVSKGEAKPVGFGHPYSEYKGYGLSVIIEALAGAIGSGCSLDETGFGHLFIAIDPTGYCQFDEFARRTEAMIDHLKSSQKRSGFEDILYPGEPEWREEDERKKLGIFIDSPWWANIIETAQALNVDVDMILKDAIVEP
jgi:uncharacterized oxidoreductase